MEVILLERVEKLGGIGDVVNVKNGFARNYLLPNKKALRANESNRKVFEANRSKIEADNAERRTDAEKASKGVDGKTVKLIRQASNTGQLYGSVSARDIVEALEGEGAKVTKSQIVLDRPIKAIGVHDVKVALHPEVAVTVKVNVARSPEEADLQAQGVDVLAQMFEDEAAPAAEELAPEAPAMPKRLKLRPKLRPKLKPLRRKPTEAARPKPTPRRPKTSSKLAFKLDRRIEAAGAIRRPFSLPSLRFVAETRSRPSVRRNLAARRGTADASSPVLQPRASGAFEEESEYGRRTRKNPRPERRKRTAAAARPAERQWRGQSGQGPAASSTGKRDQFGQGSEPGSPAAGPELDRPVGSRHAAVTRR